MSSWRGSRGESFYFKNHALALWNAGFSIPQFTVANERHMLKILPLSLH